MLKKVIIGVIIAMIAPVISVTSAFAGYSDGVCDRKGVCGTCGYIDQDGDGVCDRKETYQGIRCTTAGSMQRQFKRGK